MFCSILLADHIRQKHKPNPDIHIMYEDQPYADFKSLFLMANGRWHRQCSTSLSRAKPSMFLDSFLESLIDKSLGNGCEQRSIVLKSDKNIQISLMFIVTIVICVSAILREYTEYTRFVWSMAIDYINIIKSVQPGKHIIYHRHESCK